MGLFDSGRKSEDVGEIHGIRMRVKAGSQPLPSPFIGGIVMGFTLATDPSEAVTTIIEAVRVSGLDVEEIDSPGFSIPVKSWESVIAETWPEIKDAFPSQAEIASRLENHGVVFSPIMGFVAD